LRVFGGVGFVGAEFVEIVVVSDVVEGRELFVNGVGAFYCGELGAGEDAR
jgi:hypothetical protein